MFQPKYEPNPRDAWFRSADWDTRSRAEFETRLARARPYNRVQYRRIKALALLASGDQEKEAAGYEMLAGNVHDHDAANFEKVAAFSSLGAHDQERGRLDAAERNLRSALEAMRKNSSGSNQLEEVRLAEVLLARGGRAQLEEARELIEERAKDPPLFLNARFRLCVAAVRVLLALGAPPQAAEWAAAALSLAGATHSGLAKHPTLGLVQIDPEMRKWLASVAGNRG